ncbi:MAG TPA: DUF2183 domain-containing protein [Pseudobdellovibrionaceae bacterium]|nr:DUF2183 domain-containing protein [Pseudobdellovibrionaceae bacterium]
MTGTAAEGAPKYVIVSDIDDTIQKSQIHWKLNPIAFAKNLFAFHDAFIGMPALYNALANDGMAFHYVTAAPKIIGSFPQRFLETSGFPAGTLWTRNSVFDPKADFKEAKILDLMRAHPDSLFILVGDNGEKDVPAYKRVQDHPEFGKRVIHTFIHKLYDDKTGVPLEPGQKPYISTAEITLDLRDADLLNDRASEAILKQVERGLQSRSSRIEQLTIPEFATYDQSSIKALATRALNEPNSEIRRLILSIATSMSERLNPADRHILPRLLEQRGIMIGRCSNALM